MGGILRKDYLLFALAMLAVFPAVLSGERLLSAELSVPTVVTNLAFTCILSLGPLLVTELEEEHSHGYELLASLPLRVREIVAAKFLLFLGAVTASVAQQLAFLKLVQAAPSLVSTAQVAALAGGVVCLVSGGIIQATILVLGYARFTVLSLAAVVTASLLPPLLLALGGTNTREVAGRVIDLLLTLSPAGIVLGGLALYTLLFLVSIALYRNVPES